MELAKFIESTIVDKDIPICTTIDNNHYVTVFGLGMEIFSFRSELLTDPISVCIITETQEQYLNLERVLKSYSYNDVKVIISRNIKYKPKLKYINEVKNFKQQRKELIAKSTTWPMKNNIKHESEWYEEVTNYDLWIIIYDKSSHLSKYLG